MPSAVYLAHPAPCECGCWCRVGCRCNGKTCKCAICDVFEEVGADYQPEVKEKLATCDCNICKRAKPEAAKRFRM